MDKQFTEPELADYAADILDELLRRAQHINDPELTVYLGAALARALELQKVERPARATHGVPSMSLH